MSEKNLDYKKEFKDLYLSPAKPVLVTVPAMHFIMVDGTGDPNGNQGFQQAVELLYGLSFTIKMSKMKNKQPEGYFEYVVPPLEGLWWIDGGEFSFEKRDNWRWTLMIRQPEFVTPKVFAWAGQELAAKKPDLPVDKARFEGFDEGRCVQVMHIGPYSTEPETMAKIEGFIRSHGLKDRLGRGGKHHEDLSVRPEESETGEDEDRPPSPGGETLSGGAADLPGNRHWCACQTPPALTVPVTPR